MEYSKIRNLIAGNTDEYNPLDIQKEIGDYIIRGYFDVYWIMDDNLTFVYVSNDFLGYDVSEIIGEKLNSFLPEEEKNIVYGFHQLRKEKNEPEQQLYLKRTQELKLYSKENSIVDIEVCSLPYFEEENNIKVTVGGARILNPSQKEKISLHDELYRYGELFNNLSTGIFKTTPKGKFIYANNILSDILGYNTGEELINANVNILDLYANPEDRKELLKNLEDSDQFEKFTAQFYDYNRMLRRIELTARAYKNTNNEIEFIEGLAYDISGHDVYMRNLERTKANLNVLIKSTRNAYLLIDSEFKIITWNPKARKIASVIWESDFETGMKITDIPAINDLNIEQSLENVLQGKDYHTQQELMIGNRTYYLDYSFQPVILEDGKTDAIVMGIEDNTNIKETQDRLHNTVIELQDIFENSLTSILVVDQNRVIRKVNSRTCELFGYRKDELIGYTADVIHCSEESYHGFRKFYDQVFQNGIIQNEEYSFCHKSGKEIILRFNGKTVQPKDESDTYKVIWNLQDITEINENRKIKDTIYKISQTLHKDDKLSDLLEEIRKHLSTIIKVDNFMIALYDESRDAFTLPLMADAHDRFTAYDASNTISKLVVKENQSYFLKSAQIQELINSGKIKVKGAMAKVWLGVPMRVKGEPIGLIAVQDYENENAYNEDDLSMLEFLSEQVSMAIANKKNEEQLKENVETKNKFFSIIAHDLKSPFNSLIGLSDLLHQDMVDNEEEKKEIYKSINETAKEGYSLLENLLFWTRSQLGKIDHNEEFFSLKDCISSIFTLLENNANLKNIELVNNADKDLKIWGDKNKIKTILRNLVSNSLKYSYSGTSIIIDAETKEHDIIISVQDFGIGLPEEMARNLFKMDDNNKRPGTNNEKGTGLGLLISREFVDHHNGHIWVESEKDKGSIFYVSLPLKKQKTEKYQGVESAEQTDSAEVKGADSQTVLVVEDVQVNFLLLQKMLQKMDFKVEQAVNGQEAVDYVENNKPALILMDINMPVLNGIEATSMIKERHPDIPIIIQTAYTSNENKTNSEKAGADGYLEKPISKDKLSQYLEKYL